MLRTSRVLKQSRDLIGKAVPFYVVNSMLPPIVIFALSRAESVVYALLAPLVAYEVACLLSIVFLFAGRNALGEYSLEPAHRLLLVAGVMGLITAFVIGGVMVLQARRNMLQTLADARGQERVKRESSAK
jgi:hypothetical protein